MFLVDHRGGVNPNHFATHHHQHHNHHHIHTPYMNNNHHQQLRSPAFNETQHNEHQLIQQQHTVQPIYNDNVTNNAFYNNNSPISNVSPKVTFDPFAPITNRPISAIGDRRVVSQPNNDNNNSSTIASSVGAIGSETSKYNSISFGWSNNKVWGNNTTSVWG